MDKNVGLTIQEAASLEGFNYYTIIKRVQRGTLRAERIEVDNHQGFEYRINLNDLTPKAQNRYYALLKSKAAEQLSIDDLAIQQNEYKGLTLHDLTETQGAEAYAWEKILKEWQKFISGHDKNTVVKTKEFISIYNASNPDKKPLAERTLRRKWELYRKYSVVALSDNRRQGNRRGTTINERACSVFLQLWLDENKPKVVECRLLTEEWARRNAPELLPLPSVWAFYTEVKKIPKTVLTFFREGEKAYSDECLPYLKRIYDNIRSNEIFSGDYHTLDFLVRDDITGEVFRPYLMAIIDVRSRKVLSIHLTKSANSDGVIIAFRKAVEKWGIPVNFYSDHGREFLVSDFGGRGNRKTDKQADYGRTILERLGVNLHMAVVKNAKAKAVERIFKNVTEEFSRLVLTYCGGKPEQKPERLKNVLLDSENIPLMSEIIKELEAYFEGWHNERASQAEGLNGLSPNACYAENLIVKRVATKEQLDLMLLRGARKQKVKRNGVMLKFGSKEVWFYSVELIKNYLNKYVFVRYNSEDLKYVHVYDENEKFICYADISQEGGFNFSGDIDTAAIRENNYRKKVLKKETKDFVSNLKSIEDAPTARKLLFDASTDNKENSGNTPAAKIIELAKFDQKYASYKEKPTENIEVDVKSMVVNALAEPEPEKEIKIDLKKMIRNAQARKEGYYDF